jgi:hypothetical protein
MSPLPRDACGEIPGMQTFAIRQSGFVLWKAKKYFAQANTRARNPAALNSPSSALRVNSSSSTTLTTLCVRRYGARVPLCR